MVRAVSASYAHGGQKVTIIARTSAVYWQVPKPLLARCCIDILESTARID
jgi:hypothetical protein